nr:hypothetical protein [Pseudomonas sp.]
MSSKSRKHTGPEAEEAASQPSQGVSVDAPAAQDFGPPIHYDYDGKTGMISSLDEAIAFVEPRSGTFEHPDGIWRTVYEALHFARTSGLHEEMVNARGMLEDALNAPREDMPDDEDDGTGSDAQGRLH